MVENLPGIKGNLTRFAGSEVALTSNEKYAVRIVDSWSSVSDRSKAQARAQRRMQEFGKLESFGVAIPHREMVFVPAKVKGSGFALVAAEKIQGVDLLTVLRSGSVVKEEIEKTCNSITSYYAQAFSQNGEFLSDISDLRQFMYGVRGEERPRIYMVDVGHDFSPWDTASSNEREMAYYRSLFMHARMIRDAEFRIGELNHARNELGALLTMRTQIHPDSNELRVAKEILG